MAGHVIQCDPSFSGSSHSVYVCGVHACMHVCMYMYRWRSENHPRCYSSVLSFFVGGWGGEGSSFTSLELTKSSMLSDQKAPRMFLSLPPLGWDFSQDF